MLSALILLLPAIAIAGPEEDAWAALNLNDYAKAYELFLPLAERGDNAKAAYTIAWLYDLGKGIEKNTEEALRWYRKAAELGHARSQYNMAVSLDDGDGIRQDQERAFYWYKKAAAQNHPKALYNLGVKYFHGEVVPKDKVKGVAMVEKSARMGRMFAVAFLGAVYMDGSAPGGADKLKAWMFIDLAYRLGEKKNSVLLGILEPKMRPEEIELAKRKQIQWLKETGLKVPPRP